MALHTLVFLLGIPCRDCHQKRFHILPSPFHSFFFPLHLCGFSPPPTRYFSSIFVICSKYWRSSIIPWCQFDTTKLPLFRCSLDMANQVNDCDRMNHPTERKYDILSVSMVLTTIHHCREIISSMSFCQCQNQQNNMEKVNILFFFSSANRNRESLLLSHKLWLLQRNKSKIHSNVQRNVEEKMQVCSRNRTRRRH